jgi:hypothetical protein
MKIMKKTVFFIIIQALLLALIISSAGCQSGGVASENKSDADIADNAEVGGEDDPGEESDENDGDVLN